MPLYKGNKECHTFEKGSGITKKTNDDGWNLLAEEVSFPVAVVNEQSLIKNAQWMQSFSENAQVQLAPHGKTSMAPELFKLQLEQGCWGISLATVPQVFNAYERGVKRIILANQLIGQYSSSLLLYDSKLNIFGVYKNKTPS